MLRSLVPAARPLLATTSGSSIAASSSRTFASSTALLNKDNTPSSRPASTSSTSTSTSTPTPTAGPSTTPASTKPLVRESSTSPKELNARPLPYLSFALGLPTPPSTAPASWRQTREKLISPEYRMASRKAIVKEATRGYFHDFHAIKSHGGKTWRAPNTLIREDRSLWFPKITGTRLSDKAKIDTVNLFHNKISILALLGSKISEEHTKSFYSPTLEAFGTNPKFQLVQINLQSNPLKSYLVSLFISSLRTQIPEELHRSYLLSSQNIELEKEALGFHNKHVGYTYLIDEKGRIRWAGGAFAEEAEQVALKACTGVLLDRVAKDAKKDKK